MKTEAWSHNYTYYCSKSHVTLFTIVGTHNYKLPKPTIALSLIIFMCEETKAKWQQRNDIRESKRSIYIRYQHFGTQRLTMGCKNSPDIL